MADEGAPLTALASEPSRAVPGRPRAARALRAAGAAAVVLCVGAVIRSSAGSSVLEGAAPSDMVAIFGWCVRIQPLQRLFARAHAH